jgi:hypothetical protein
LDTGPYPVPGANAPAVVIIPIGLAVIGMVNPDPDPFPKLLGATESFSPVTYPVPLLTKVTDSIDPFDAMVISAVAPVPEPPTSGTPLKRVVEEYPEPADIPAISLISVFNCSTPPPT